MGPDASIGPITPEGEAVKVDYREPVKILARRKGKDPDLFAGLLDRDADLKLVRTADRQVHYLLPENLAEFLKANQVADADIQPAWEGGSRGVLIGPAGPRGRASPSSGPTTGPRSPTSTGSATRALSERPDAPPGAQAGLDRHRRADRPDQGGVPPPEDRAGPARGGQPRLLQDQQPGRPEHRRPTTSPR